MVEREHDRGIVMGGGEKMYFIRERERDKRIGSETEKRISENEENKSGTNSAPCCVWADRVAVMKNNIVRQSK